MQIPRTLLLTPTRPGESTVGEIFLRDLCRFFPPTKLVCFATTAEEYELGVASPELSWLPTVVRRLPPEKVTGRRGKPASTLKCLTHLSAMRRRLEPLIDEAVEYARKEKVELIWAVIPGPAMIYIASAVAQRLKLPMMPLVWDPLDNISADRGYDKISQEVILKEFGRVLELSQCCATASEGMKETIEWRYDRPCEVLIASPDPQISIDRGPALRNKGEFVIGFAGTIYATEEFQALTNALTSIGWQIEGRDVRLRILSNKLNMSIYTAAQKCRVEFLGFHNTAETIEQLSNADLAYLPYWFAEKQTSSVRQCFPNKFATYLAAGCPVLYHGPEDSSPTRFLERYPVGLACHSMEPEAIIATLRRFVTDESLRRQAAAARQQALTEELSPTVMRGRLAKLLGADVNQLLPA